MNTVNLKVAANSFIKSPYVSVDGEPVKLRRKGEWYVGSVETDKTDVSVTVNKYYELSSKWWFPLGLLFFFISLFGIFDSRWGGKFHCIDFSATLQLQPQTNVEIKFFRFVEGGSAVQITGNCAIGILSNVYYSNKMLRRRRRILVWVEVLIWLGMIGGTIGTTLAILL